MRGLADEARRDGIAKLVAGAVVHHEGRVLVLRRSAEDDFLPGIEELPSGGAEDGESLEEALARELDEEIGWQAPAEDGFVARFDYVSGSGRKARQYTFSVPWAGQAIVLSDEHTAFRWLHPDAVDDSDLTPESVQVIREWALAHWLTI